MDFPSFFPVPNVPRKSDEKTTAPPAPVASIDPAELCPLCPNERPPTPRSLAGFQNPKLIVPASSLIHPSFPINPAGQENAHASSSTQSASTPATPDLSWIACTRCRIWYHSVCLLIGGCVEPGSELNDAGKGLRPTEVELKASIPEEVLEEVGRHRKGVWWDWTGRVDRWYCPSCVHKATRTSSRSIPRSTLKRNRQPSPPSPPSRQPSASPSDITMTDPTVPQRITASGRPKRTATLNTPDYHALHNHISTPTGKWLSLISDPAKSGGRKISEDPYVRVSGSLLTKEWMEGESVDDYPGSRVWLKRKVSDKEKQLPPPSILWGTNREPIVIPSSLGGFASTGGRLPPSKITIDEIATLVGKERVVDVIDVASQSSNGWTLTKWAEYVKGRAGEDGGGGRKSEDAGIKSKDRDRDRDRDRGKVFNVISLEISGTALAKQVRPPKLVSEIDWVDNFWPANKKSPADSPSPAPASTTLPSSSITASLPTHPPTSTSNKSTHPYPKVQLYCLMGMKGSWTDWHVDFAASSVYYTVLRGAKTFFFIRPTEGNLAAYAKWSGSHEHQQEVWLGDWCDEVRKVTLEAGDTMIIPTGYIHAVHTPEDSLVFGGNYLHSYNIETQLRLREIEIETKVPQRFRFPYLDRLSWYVADAYVKELRSVMAFRPHSSAAPVQYHPRVLDGLLALANFLVQQIRLIEKNTGGDDKARKLIHDRVPSDFVKDAAGLAREIRWRIKALIGENSEDEGSSSIVPGSKKRKRRQVEEDKSSAPTITFATSARTRRYRDVPWEIQEEAVDPAVSIVQRLRPATADVLEGGKLEPAVEESAIVRQTRKRVRPAEEGAGVVEEWQEVAITTTTTRWTNDKRVIVQAAQRQSRMARSQSASERAGSMLDAASSISDEAGPRTPSSASFPLGVVETEELRSAKSAAVEADDVEMQET